MSDPLLIYRPEFPILERTTYLVSNSLGAMPRGVPNRLAEYVDQWAERGVRAWADGWWEMPIAVGDEIAPLIGAPAGSVAMTPNELDHHGLSQQLGNLAFYPVYRYNSPVFAEWRMRRSDGLQSAEEEMVYLTSGTPLPNGWRGDS